MQTLARSLHQTAQTFGQPVSLSACKAILSSPEARAVKATLPADQAKLLERVVAGKRIPSSAYTALLAATDRVGQSLAEPERAGLIETVYRSIKPRSPKARASAIVFHQLMQATTIDETMTVALKHYPEIHYLLAQVLVTPEGKGCQNPAQSVSLRTKGKQYEEFDRTILGVHLSMQILKGDREGFTKCQPETDRLSEASFERIQGMMEQNLKRNPSLVDALIAYSIATDALTTFQVVNDLGKVVRFVDLVVKDATQGVEDHDKILLEVILKHPKLAPTVRALPPKYRKLIIDGIKLDYNIMQLMQGENVAANLATLKGASQEVIDFYAIHALFDLAGAAGQVRQDGSLTVTESTFKKFERAKQMMDRARIGDDPAKIYDDYLRGCAQDLNQPFESPSDRVIMRICCMMRANAGQAALVREEYQNLPDPVRAILDKEMTRTGINDGVAILPYYSPALFKNLLDAFKKTNQRDVNQAVRLTAQKGMITLARGYFEARKVLKDKNVSGIYTANFGPISDMVKVNPNLVTESAFVLKGQTTQGSLSLESRNSLDLSALGEMSLSELGGKNYVIIAVGGGSDIATAGTLAAQLAAEGKTVSLISARKRTPNTNIIDPIARIGENVFQIGPDTTGTVGTSGRFFFEALPASNFSTFLTTYGNATELPALLASALEAIGEHDTVICMDTGGDSWGGVETDQDVEVLRAVHALNSGAKTMLAVVAPGIDSPADMEARLHASDTLVYYPDNTAKFATLASYEQMGMNPNSASFDAQRFGTTPFIRQAALNAQFGLVILPIPKKRVQDDHNPWSPFAFANSPQAAIVFTSLAQYIATIDAQP